MKKGIHRRNFIRTTALAGAGVLVAKPLSPLLAFNGSPGEKVVVGVVGTNSRGATLANIFAGTTNVEVGYICDVDENVLIPRPETEELVDWISKENSEGVMLDIGTGSGCIPVSLKKKLPVADIHACDVSGSALIVAQKNANENKTPIQFHQLDFLDPEQRKSLPSFDIIVSNPPYIPQKDKPEMHKNVLNHEPHIALFVEDDDPLIFYKAIASFATDHLKKDGAIYMEIHERLGRDVLRLFNESGFTKTILRKDLQEKDRMVKAMR